MERRRELRPSCHSRQYFKPERRNHFATREIDLRPDNIAAGARDCELEREPRLMRIQSARKVSLIRVQVGKTVPCRIKCHQMRIRAHHGLERYHASIDAADCK